MMFVFTAPPTTVRFVPIPQLAATALIRFVRPEPLPLKLPAVITPAEKLPDPSRFTRVPAMLEFVAAFAAFAPAATFATDRPPTIETNVAFCVPVTSPASGPEKLSAVDAVEAEVALVAWLAVVALPALAE